MASIAELRATVQRKTGNLYDTYFTRRVSVYITWVLQRTGVTPNHVSYFNLVNGLAAAALIGLGTPRMVLMGLGMVHLYAVLDSVDGELARLRAQFSLRGLYLEDYSAYVMINALWLGYSGYLYRFHALTWPLGFAVLFAAFGRNAMPVARRAILSSIERGRPPAGGVQAAPDTAVKTGLVGVVRESVLHLTNIWMTMTLLVAVDVLAAPALPIVAVGFAFYSAGLALKEGAILFRYLFTERLERELGHAYHAARSDQP